ncbi:MAG: amidohydrolase [Ruminococcus sp.]|nr:amidohydrolase [Ruminococcus sp.]
MRIIFYNGTIYTGEMPLQEAFVVENNKFLYAGNWETAKSMATEDAEWVDLEGKFVCSGFNDSHMHLLGFGKALQQAQLANHTQSLADMIACLSEFAEISRKSNWILGRGWNQDYFSDADRMPNRYDLDQVSLEQPVCIVRACGHCLVVNSKALELMEMTEEKAAKMLVEGGKIGMENGILDGRFYDNAMDLVYEKIPAPSCAEIKDMILAACKELNSYGITSCQTDDYCAFQNVPWEEINEAYRELEETGELTVRVYEQSNFTSLEALRGFVEAGNMTGKGSDFFKIGPLKMLGDGALGARTAFLSRPYADDATTFGIPVFSKKQFEEMISYANAKNMQVAVHTIGDACLDWVLDAFEKALTEHPRQDHRHGIVHCQITRADQLERIRKLGLHVYAQTIFLDYDINIVEARVGKELAATSYRWKTLMKRGVTVSNGSDCPVELPDVMAGIQCAVTRKNLAGNIAAYHLEEGFTLQEALDSYTSCGSRSSFEETLKGKICSGMLADFVVLDENPFTVEHNKLKDIGISATYLDGKKVFG